MQPSDACACHMAILGWRKCFCSWTNVFVSIFDVICILRSSLGLAHLCVHREEQWDVGGLMHSTLSLLAATASWGPEIMHHASPPAASFKMYKARCPSVFLISELNVSNADASWDFLQTCEQSHSSGLEGKDLTYVRLVCILAEK